ncbi:hypothetical protein ABL602_004508 [Salmonella enterica subsp. enterica]|nr:hypothetical protein [Salmonella enterica subsp. enterica]EIY5768796.1 hypothetical protein [Salmonella enterica subsp. enterica]
MNKFQYKYFVKVSVLFCTVFFSLTVSAKIQPRDAYVATSSEFYVFGGTTHLFGEISLNTPIEFQYEYIHSQLSYCTRGESLPGKTSPIDPDGSHGQSTYWKAWWLYTSPYLQDSEGWINLNDYAQIKVVFKNGRGSADIGQWFPGGYGGGASSCSPQRMEAGTTSPESEFAYGKMYLRITKRPADGVIRLPNGPFMSLYLAYSDLIPTIGRPSAPVLVFQLSGTEVIVPAACRWIGASAMEIDYGVMGRKKRNTVRSRTPFLQCNGEQNVRLSLFALRGINTSEHAAVDLTGTATAGEVVGTGYVYFADAGRELVTSFSGEMQKIFEIESVIDSSEMPAGTFEGSAVLTAYLE